MTLSGTTTYMHNPESVQQNEMHKFLWDFNVQPDHQNTDLVIVNKRRELAEYWILPSRQTTEKRKESHVKELWKKQETVIPVITISKSLVKGLEELEIGGTAETIRSTALRSARIPRRVTQTPVEN